MFVHDLHFDNVIAISQQVTQSVADYSIFRELPVSLLRGTRYSLFIMKARLVASSSSLVPGVSNIGISFICGGQTGWYWWVCISGEGLNWGRPKTFSHRRVWPRSFNFDFEVILSVVVKHEVGELFNIQP